MLAQTDYEFPPTLLVLVLELNASLTACHSLGYRDHSVLDNDPREKRRLPQPGVAVGERRAGPYACCDDGAGFCRIAQPKLHGRVSARAQADQMSMLDLDARERRCGV